ncbi:MAG: hypothetical protein ACTSRS_09525 [Candidatus Helarchaeota archaeon]
MAAHNIIKWVKVSVGIFIVILPLFALIFVASSGIIDISAVLEFVNSPIVVVIILEYSLLVLMIESFLVSKRFRRTFRLCALIIAFGLFTFYTLIPFLPITIVVNHPDNDWDHGKVVHILPAVSENRILLKTSFEIPLTAPQLNVNGTYFNGTEMDTQGFFWAFDVQGLTANTTYELKLETSTGEALCDPWVLKTFPARNSTPQHLRILVFTGSGGHDACRSWYGQGQIPLAIRQRLLNKALSLHPDVLVGSGDQVYYDVRYGVSSKTLGDSRRAVAYSGKFDYSKPILGTANEDILKRAVGPQIAYLYGTACRSIPTFFILDDHDYFANDDAYEKDTFNFQLLLAWLNPIVKACVTFPPDPFMLEAGRAVQRLYLPEFLPNPDRPLTLPGTNAPDRTANVSECFGTLRYGNLLEGVLYDVRRYLTLTGLNATFIPKEAEQWIEERALNTTASYFIQFSPISWGWSAGKWLSWYPDVKTKIAGQPVLTTNLSKYMWQPGWFAQHNRLLNATFQSNATTLLVCGDMHTQTAGMIVKSGDLDLSSKPIPSLLTGALGVDGGGFPSGGLRGIAATPPTDLQVIENLTSYEKAGFVILDITPENITAQFYGWRYRQDSVEMIDTLTSHFTFVVKAH